MLPEEREHALKLSRKTIDLLKRRGEAEAGRVWPRRPGVALHHVLEHRVPALDDRLDRPVLEVPRAPARVHVHRDTHTSTDDDIGNCISVISNTQLKHRIYEHELLIIATAPEAHKEAAVGVGVTAGEVVAAVQAASRLT